MIIFSFPQKKCTSFTGDALLILYIGVIPKIYFLSSAFFAFFLLRSYITGVPMKIDA